MSTTSHLHLISPPLADLGFSRVRQPLSNPEKSFDALSLADGRRGKGSRSGGLADSLADGLARNRRDGRLLEGFSEKTSTPRKAPQINRHLAKDDDGDRRVYSAPDRRDSRQGVFFSTLFEAQNIAQKSNQETFEESQVSQNEASSERSAVSPALSKTTTTAYERTNQFLPREENIFFFSTFDPAFDIST